MIRPRLEPPPLYFLHLPKTAGMALNAWLERMYRKSDVVHVWGPVFFPRQSLAEFREFQCYICHYGYALYELAQRPGLMGMTLLRDPVERAISDVYHHQNDLIRYPEMFTPEYCGTLEPFWKADLRACLQRPEFRRLIDNRQTRELGIRRDYRPWFSDGALGSRGEHLLVPADAPALSEDQDLAGILAEARRHLDGLSLVGITERFPDFLRLICAATGLPHPPAPPVANVGLRKQGIDLRAYRSSTPPDLLEQVESLNQFDLELYRYATGIFEQQWARHIASPQRVYSLGPRIRNRFARQAK